MKRDRSAEFLKHLEQRRKTLRDEVEDDVAPLRSLTLGERGKIVESVCRDAMAILRGRPDYDEAIKLQDRRSDESMRLWLRLVERYRGNGRH